MKSSETRSTGSGMRRMGEMLLAVLLGMAVGCAGGNKGPGVPVVEKPAQLQYGAPDLSQFFCLNAITPFHQKTSPDPAVRTAVWTTLKKQLAVASKLGASQIRVDMWWGVIEPEKGDYEWDFPDRVINAIVDAGLEPYPILCYNSAWNPDDSPNTPEARDEFGDYVYEMVKRYKNKVHTWEVWNEPNVSPFWVPKPDPVAYTELLKVAYSRAKEADPSCTVVGFCTAGADTRFIESGYKDGAQGYFDALSFHHYSDIRDESVLENEIDSVRRVMERYGDGQKPILITEMGLSTGPSTLMRAFSDEEQASWMVKKYLVCAAEGVSQVYWFKMMDDAAATNPDGYWGLLRSDYTWKPSAWAFDHMTNLLSDAWYIGRAWRVTEDPNRAGDVECLLFRNRDEIFAVAWVRQDGKKANILLPATSSVPVEDMKGKTLLEADPNERKYVVIPVTKEPRFIRDLPLRAVPLGSIHFTPNPVSISPGETQTVTMSIENPLDTPLSIDLADLMQPPAGGHLTIVAPETRLDAAPQTVTHVALTVSLPPDAPKFTAQEFVYSDPLKYSYQLRIEYEDPFHIRMLVEQDGKRGKLTTYFTNRTEATVSGEVSWKIRGKDVGRPEPFTDLNPGGTASVDRKIAPALNAATIESIVRTGLGVTGTGTLRLYGQPLVEKPPVIDGDLSDWKDVPGIDLTPAENQVRPTDHKLSKDHFSGTVKLEWTKDHLYVAADVVDAVPMVNPFQGTDIWRGDAIELYLGFDGPTLDTSYGPEDFQIGISPGNNGENPLVWNWRPRPIGDAAPPQGGAAIDDATVAAVRSDKGYRLEASIPLDSLGVTLGANQFIGFDAALDDLDNPALHTSEAVLIWNGHGTGWTDPSTWGVGVILPEETKK